MLLCFLIGPVFKSVQWGPKKSLLGLSQLGTSPTIEVLKDPARVEKKKKKTTPDDVHKKPNIPLFHIGTWFSLKAAVKRAEL